MLTNLRNLPLECYYIIAGQWAYCRTTGDQIYELAQWYPYRALPGHEREESANPVGVDNDVFPAGSIAVDKPGGQVLFRKYEQGWGPVENVLPDRAIRMLEFQVIEQERYRYGEPPAVTPVWFNTLLSDAKLGQVEDPDAQAFDNVFENPKKEKFMVRLRLPRGMSRDSTQHNLHRRGKPINRAELARIVAKEVEQVMGGRSFIANDRNITFEDLILVDVHWVSVGSVQVTLATKYYSKGPLF